MKVYGISVSDLGIEFDTLEGRAKFAELLGLSFRWVKIWNYTGLKYQPVEIMSFSLYERENNEYTYTCEKCYKQFTVLAKLNTDRFICDDCLQKEKDNSIE
jgi:hypothetical protein